MVDTRQALGFAADAVMLLAMDIIRMTRVYRIAGVASDSETVDEGFRKSVLHDAYVVMNELGDILNGADACSPEVCDATDGLFDAVREALGIGDENGDPTDAPLPV